MYRIKKAVYSSTVRTTLGAVIMGTALSVFLVPFKIAPGGVSGLASALYNILGIRVSVLIALINLPIFAAAWVVFDKGFLLRSIYGMFALSAASELMSRIELPVDDPLLAAVFGGALMGAGIATVLTGGGTTGGTDIAVMTIRKFKPDLSVGKLFMIIDGIIIMTAGIILKSFETVLYSAVALFVSGRVTDAVIEGLDFAKLVYIMSGEWERITERIYTDMKRGVTALESYSMYSKKEGRILLCVIRKRELTRLKKMINDTDPAAFVVVADAKEILGRGFEKRI